MNQETGSPLVASFNVLRRDADHQIVLPATSRGQLIRVLEVTCQPGKKQFVVLEAAMQDAVGIITLVLVTLLAIVFLMVLRRASAPADPGATADPGRYRAPLFWLLVVVGIGVSYGTLVEWPYGPGPATSGEPMTVAVTGSIWSWEINPTKLPVGKPIVFAVTSSDVNHGVGIYDPDLKMLTQVQAMPGYINKVYYTFSKAGTYKILCLEYCGLGHHVMAADLTVGP